MTPPRERRAKLAQLMASSAVSDKPHIIFEWCSWPFGEEGRGRWRNGCQDEGGVRREEQSGNPGNSVDLREFVELFREHGDVKVLVLHRGLVSAAWSHREWDGGLVPHTRVLALFNDYLTKVLGALSPGSWRWIQYEDICEAHKRGEFAALAALADFLDLPHDLLARSFRHFSPSRKDAACEMPADSLKTIRLIEKQQGADWFPTRFPQQQLAIASDIQPHDTLYTGPTAVPQAVDPKPSDSIAKALERWVKSLTPAQASLFQEVLRAQQLRDQKSVLKATERLQRSLTEDQLFEWRRVLLKEAGDKATGATDVDPKAFTSLHMWLEGRGFGSEVNNLISAAIYCDQHGLACVVEDENWNAGRLHGYFQAEPLVMPSHQPFESSHRILEVKRQGRVASQGWFAVQRHARSVSFQTKARYASKFWRYTPATEAEVEEMNRELDLPLFYVAVHIRRGDKVSGERQEALAVPTSSYVRAAREHLRDPCTAVVVCSDDSAAAADFATEMAQADQNADVRRRRRPSGGHWQASWNAEPLRERVRCTHEFLADIDVLRGAHVCLCTHSSNVGRLVALLRDGLTVSLDEEWSNT